MPPCQAAYPLCGLPLPACPAYLPLQIFTERPEVHRAYLAHVPNTLDEKAFWTRYFKQQYKRMARRYAFWGRLELLLGAAAGLTG